VVWRVDSTAPASASTGVAKHGRTTRTSSPVAVRELCDARLMSEATQARETLLIGYERTRAGLAAARDSVPPPRARAADVSGVLILGAFNPTVRARNLTVQQGGSPSICACLPSRDE
jgi:hypothetical protein